MKKFLRSIDIVSIVILLVVIAMFGIRQKFSLGAWSDKLPFYNAIINSATAVLLLLGLYFIKSGNIAVHKRVMSLAFAFGGLFLVSYVLYHISHVSTPFGGTGFVRNIYYFNLITHILASFAVLPFVLRAYYFGLNRMDVEHRKVTRIAFPIWLYVSISGVIAYLMISPYYTF
jgi:putative membrane protein